MLKRVAILALCGVFACAQSINDPTCEVDADCLFATCNNPGPLFMGIPDVHQCNQPNPPCDPNAPRRADGICNNLVPGQAYFGATRELQIRIANASQDLLNARTTALDVSDVMLNNFVPTPNTFGFSNMLVIMGQFIDHDVTLIDLLPEGRRVRGEGSIEDMDFPLSERVGEDPNIENPRFINAISAYLDLTQVYGGDEPRLAALRDTRGGRMRSQIVDGQEFMPFNDELPGGPISMAMGNIPDTFAAGDIRATEQIILTAFHTLFVREHNRLAEEFTQQGMNDEEAFQAARARNIAQYQNIVYNEFLPGFLGPNPLPPYTGYDNTVNAEVTAAFSTALYRIGHSGVANEVLSVDSNGNEMTRTLADVFFSPSAFLETPDAVGALMLGAKRTCHERFDPEIQDSLRRLLFENVLDEPADLGALNIERARDHQLASYNEIRASLNLSATSINGLTDRRCLVDDMNSVFDNIDEASPFVAALAEDPVDNSQFGETINAALRDQFRRFRDGDRFFFENVEATGFSEEELREIRATRMSDIITRNTFVEPDQVGISAFTSEQCCFTGGASEENMMCVQSAGGVVMQSVEYCDQEDMTSSGQAWFPGTTNPNNNIFYDCQCVAAATVSSASKASAGLALGAVAVASLAAL